MHERTWFLRRKLAVAAGLATLSVAAVLSWCGCSTTPITGRRQLVLVSETREIALGEQAYREILAEETPTANAEVQRIVERVGRRIAAVAGRPDYQWEFRVIASEELNAFALPGGKVAVYEGILPVCRNEAGLAVVMSHEIAHALARHGGERMSQTAVSDGVRRAVDWATRDEEEEERQVILTAYGVASEYGVLLPYSRKHESEADRMGLSLMAQAGYDPSEAPRFWRRFSEFKPGNEPPEFLSTHPSDERRMNDLLDLLPEALPLYESAPRKYGLGEPLPTASRNRQPGGGLVHTESR